MGAIAHQAGAADHLSLRLPKRGDHAGFVLCSNSHRILHPALGLYESLGTALGGSMEYAIAGIITAVLFVYLVYALLRPEKF